MKPSLITAVVVAAAITTACGANPATEQKPVTVSTPTTTSEAPGADPVAWFEAYCGPMGVAALAQLEVQGKAPQGMAAVKDAVVRWAATTATSDRMIADGLEKLGPMGSDVRNPHERLIKSLRESATGFEEASGRLRALAADDVFPERYEQVMATSGGGARENAGMMLKQILDVPKYGEVFRANKVCVGWQGVAKQAGGK